MSNRTRPKHTASNPARAEEVNRALATVRSIQLVKQTRLCGSNVVGHSTDGVHPARNPKNVAEKAKLDETKKESQHRKTQIQI